MRLSNSKMMTLDNTKKLSRICTRTVRRDTSKSKKHSKRRSGGGRRTLLAMAPRNATEVNASATDQSEMLSGEGGQKAGATPLPWREM